MCHCAVCRSVSWALRWMHNSRSQDWRAGACTLHAVDDVTVSAMWLCNCTNVILEKWQQPVAMSHTQPDRGRHSQTDRQTEGWGDRRQVAAGLVEFWRNSWTCNGQERTICRRTWIGSTDMSHLYFSQRLSVCLSVCLLLSLIPCGPF